MASIRFQPLTEADLPLMHRWLNTEHVMKHYSPGGRTFEQVKAKYIPYIQGTQPTRPYLILHGDTPVGYIQGYFVEDWPDFVAAVGGVEPGTASIDLFIGEADAVGKGLGSAAVRAFLQEIIFGEMGASACIIGPHANNPAAIRAYEKAGFRYWKTVQEAEEPYPTYLMRLEAKSDLSLS